MDWNSWAVQLVVALTPVATTMIVWAVRLLIPRIPRVALPVIAMFLPVAASWFYSFAGGQFTPIVAALLGAAAVWLREIVNTFNEHRLNP